MSHGHSHGGGHGHSHGGGGGHGHSHGGGGGQQARPGSQKDGTGMEQGIYDGYTIGDQNQASRTPKYVYQTDPQVRRAYMEAERTAGGAKGKKGKKGQSADHGHSHGGGGEQTTMLEAQPTPEYLEQYCYAGFLAHVVLLHAQGVDVKRISNTASDTEGATTLMWAALNGHLPIVKFLKGQGVDINAATRDGQTALHWAVTEGHFEVVRYLHEHGADFNAKDVRGFDAYTVAIQQDSFPMLIFLNELRPLDPEATDSDGHTYAHWCAYRNNFAALEYVHQSAKVAIDAVDNKRRTPLHWAAREGAVEAITYLLSNGLVATAPDAEGIDSVAHAVARGHTAAAQALRSGKTMPVSYLTSTLSLISTKLGMALFLAPFAVILGFFLGVRVFPPIICFFIPSMLTLKNPIVHFRSVKASRATVPAGQPATEQPRDIFSAMRGTWLTRRREPYIVGLMLALVFFEYLAMTTGPAPLPRFFIPLAGLTLLFAVLAKRAVYSTVVAGKSLQHSDLVRAVRDGRTELLNSRQMDVDRHVRLPLRAAYCIEADRYFRRYDSWSLLLDAPLTAANHHWFVYFTGTFAVFQAYVAFCGMYFIHYKYCDDVCSTAFPYLDFDGVLATIAYIVTGGLTCRDEPADPDAFFGFGKYVSSPMNAAAPFVWAIPGALAFTLAQLTYSHLRNAANNITRAEALHPYAMATDGTMASIMRSMGNKAETIYGSGSQVANTMMFLLGRQTVYARSDEYEIPAPAPGTKLFSVKRSEGGCCGGH